MSESLRVLHIGPTPFFSDRGCHVRIRGLMTALERAGTDGWLCTYHHGRDVADVETERIARVPGYTRIAAGPSPFKYLADLFLFFRVCGSILRRRPHLLHGHLHEGALIGQAARMLLFWRRLPLVFDMQGSLTGELEEHGYFRAGGLLSKLFAGLEWLIDRMPSRIAASSESSLRIARERFGVRPERIALVADATDVAEPDDSAVDALRRQLDLPPSSSMLAGAAPRAPASAAAEAPVIAAGPVVVYSGSLLAAKGLESLQEAMLTVANRLPEAHFLLIGYPVEATAEFVGRAGIADRCTLTGRVDFERIGEYLALGDIGIEPKAGEAGEASGKLLNYMAAGLPVVCFDTPNNRRMLGDAGCYASPGSIDELVERIVELAEQPDERCRIGERNRQRVRAEYSWDASAAVLQDLYRECLR